MFISGLFAKLAVEAALAVEDNGSQVVRLLTLWVIYALDKNPAP